MPQKRERISPVRERQKAALREDIISLTDAATLESVASLTDAAILEDVISLTDAAILERHFPERRFLS